MFAEADSNNNGLLDLKEYTHHCTLNDAYGNKKFGGDVHTPEDLIKPCWDFFNTMTPGTHGISRVDFSRIFRLWEEAGKRMQP